LLHVLDLWSPGARIVWQYGITNSIGLLSGIGSFDRNADVLPTSIRTFLETRTISGQRPILEAYFDSFRAYLAETDVRRRRGEPYATLNPAWVTLWEPWRRRVGLTADDWCNAVGLAKGMRQMPTWVVPLMYPVWRAKRLIRPTQLEAGWYGRHFPTPPSCTASSGGRVVEGRESVFSAKDYRALPEFIHAPVELVVQDWIATGMPVLPLSGIVGDATDLKRDRDGHWTSLRREFASVDDWMNGVE
jgi:hypothetical protein